MAQCKHCNGTGDVVDLFYVSYQYRNNPVRYRTALGNSKRKFTMAEALKACGEMLPVEGYHTVHIEAVEG